MKLLIFYLIFESQPYSNEIAVMHIDLRLVLKYPKSWCTECDSGQRALASLHLLLMEKEVSNA